MLRTRIILLVVVVALIAAFFFLPKSVVENDSQLQSGGHETTQASAPANPHGPTAPSLRRNINRLRTRYLSGLSEEKNAIFADSLTALYKQAGLFDSAAWYAERAATFFNTDESLLKAGNAYYEAYTFAVSADMQKMWAGKTREAFGQVLARDPKNLEVKTKMAMTYLSSPSPMQGITLLREVLAEDPRNVMALFNMGMLAVQSGQYAKAVEWLEKLVLVDENHLQGQLLLGVAYSKVGQTEKARLQFEKVKKMDPDPSVKATADSYLEELK